MTYCETWDMPTDQCAHCRGITTPNLDQVTIPDHPVRQAALAAYKAKRTAAPLEPLAREVLRAVDVYHGLEDALLGTRTGGDAGPAGTKVEAPLPLQAEVAEHRHLLLRGLRHWCAVVQQQARRATRPTTGRNAQVEHLAAYIIGGLPHLDDVSQDELRGNLRDWMRGARTRTDLPALRGSIPLPGVSCPDRAEVDGETLYACAGEVRVMLPADKGTPLWLSCGTCRARWAVTDLPEAANMRLPLSALADLTGIPLRTLQWRAQQGRLPMEGGTARLGDAVESDQQRADA